MARGGVRKDTEHVHESNVVAHLHRTSVYLLDNVSSDVSATEIRRRGHDLELAIDAGHANRGDRPLERD